MRDPKEKAQEARCNGARYEYQHPIIRRAGFRVGATRATRSEWSTDEMRYPIAAPPAIPVGFADARRTNERPPSLRAGRCALEGMEAARRAFCDYGVHEGEDVQVDDVGTGLFFLFYIKNVWGRSCDGW